MDKQLLTRPKQLDDLGIDGCFNYEKDGWIFQDVIDRVGPNEILETGFFRGGSAYNWLHMSEANLTSVDPMVNLYEPWVKHDGKIENVKLLMDTFPSRFTFFQKSSSYVKKDLQLTGKHFELFSIDGDHWPKGIQNDFQLALDLKVDYVIADDFVTDVEQVYNNEFSNYFRLIKIYDRCDYFLGKPIPMHLLQVRK